MCGLSGSLLLECDAGILGVVFTWGDLDFSNLATVERISLVDVTHYFYKTKGMCSWSLPEAEEILDLFVVGFDVDVLD